MNYAYDLTINFNKKYIDFYEWNKDDNLEYYVKIPIFNFLFILKTSQITSDASDRLQYFLRLQNTLAH